MTKHHDHNIFMGYLLWVFGFIGAHRFYFGRPISGTIWFLTLGLFGIGWIIDLFLIPNMAQQAQSRYQEGQFRYDLAWVLLTFLGILGIHRFYLNRCFSGIVFLLTGGLFGLGLLYDFWTLNEKIHEINSDSTVTSY